MKGAGETKSDKQRELEAIREHQRVWADWEFMRECLDGGLGEFESDQAFCDAIGMRLKDYYNILNRVRRKAGAK